MVFRMLRTAGGMWMSPPGVDVRTANPLDLLFSSDFRTPSLVMKGQIVTASSSDPAGGFGQNVYRLPYGRVINPVPYVVAVAQFPYTWNGHNKRTDQFSYLAGRWHTPVFEAPGFTKTTVYGNGEMQKGVTGIALSFASYKFIVAPSTSYVDFLVNGVPAGITIKYAILDIN